MIKLDAQGLIPAVVQDDKTGEVLVMAYMSPAALKKTLEGPDVWFYSRSRGELWHKGDTSGNYLKVKSVSADCDGDTLLVRADPEGPTCHTGNRTCFFNPLDDMPEATHVESGAGVLDELYAVIQDRKVTMPEKSYTTRLFKEGVDRIAQKVIEEAGESAIAAVRGKNDELAGEVADLLYHTLVMLAATGVRPEEVWARLRERRK